MENQIVFYATSLIGMLACIGCNSQSIGSSTRKNLSTVTATTDANTVERHLHQSNLSIQKVIAVSREYSLVNKLINKDDKYDVTVKYIIADKKWRVVYTFIPHKPGGFFVINVCDEKSIVLSIDTGE